MISTARLYNYFASNFLLKKSSKNWHAFDCQFCVDGDNKKKMAVHFGYQLVKCWVCGYRERAVNFVMDAEGLTYPEAKLKIESYLDTGINVEGLYSLEAADVKPLKLPYGYQSILEGTGLLSDRARRYLSKRGFDLEELDIKGFGYVKESPPTSKDPDEQAGDYYGYIIIPFKKEGKLVYWIARNFMNNRNLKYKNPPKGEFGIGKSELLYNEEAIRIHKKIFVTEGWACAETMGKKGVATLGWSLSDEQKRIIMSGVVEELVFLPDKGFYTQAIQTAMDFLDTIKTVKVVKMDDFIGEGNDPNSIGKESVLELLKQTKALSFGSAVRELI